MRRLVPPTLLFLAILAVAPFLGLLRDVLLERFERTTLFVGLAALAGLCALGIVARVRRLEPGQRWKGWTSLGILGALVAVQQGLMRTGEARVDLVEAIHLVEYGLLALLIDRALRQGPADLGDVLLPVVATVLAGTADELVQALSPQRVGDIRDVFLDGWGGLCGTVAAFGLRPPPAFRWRPSPASRRRLARTTAVTILAAAAFFSFAHLGYEIHDPRVGSFRSSFPRERLLEVSAERARQWSADPPTGLAVIGIEDRFLTEAAWQALHRNAALEAGDLAHAWPANRILELYYDPFLDLESFRGAGRHRWPEPLRARLDAERPTHHPESFVSPVLEGRIRTWPRGPFLLAATLAAGAAWLLGGRGPTGRSDTLRSTSAGSTARETPREQP